MEKIKKLQEAKKKLKSEFIGLDNVIDKVIDSITPWYLTPEVLERPVVISLFGLTGTGKTSLIRKLVNHLDLSGKTLLFDCGEQGGSSDTRLFSEKLDELFETSQVRENDIRYSEGELSRVGIEIKDKEINKTDPLDYTFIFDEFQYLNTKSPSTGEEQYKPEGRAIWNLMDSGLIDVNSYNYKIKSIMDYLEDIEVFSDSHPNVSIADFRFPKEYSDILKQQLAYYRWADDNEEETKSDDKKGYKVLFDEDFSFLIKRLNLLQKGLGFKVGDKLKTFTKLSDFIVYIKNYVELISKPKVINCSKSLIFVIGNLDEAFNLTTDDLDPDIDADVYHEITSKVNCMDIKAALKKRFRDEQIGRLGNNIIIYPSLRRCDFEEIIDRELKRIKTKFKSYNGIDIDFSNKLKDLIYFEGCFPIQGVRPVYSTINYIISPLLSLILVSGRKDEMILDVYGDGNFNVPQIKLVVDSKGDNNRIGEKLIQLNLGSLRSPERCKKIGLQAVHEASHSVIYYLLTGKLPSAIIASNIFGSGGYMMNEINTDSSTENILELKNDVMVSLAGYYGERAFFDSEMCSLGTSSDINAVWVRLRYAFYQSGLSIPMSFSEKHVSDQNDGLPFGFPVEEKDSINKELMNFFNICCAETKTHIKAEIFLIAKISEYLLKNRSMGTEKFKEYVEKYGKTFKDVKQPDENYYNNTIKNIIYGHKEID